MLRIGAALKNTFEQLRAAGIETCRLDAELLVCQAANCSRVHLITRDDTMLTPQQEADLEVMLSRRLKHEPMQYILGHCEFMGLDFKVNGNTLIPRPDIGTGSGAIIISLASLGNIEGVGVDISESALRVACENAAINAVDDKVSFIKSDLFENITGRFDIIVSNPPYIESGVIPTLGSNVKDYEPVSALDGGSDGLDFYRAIASKASEHLNKPGLIAFEIGYNQAEAVKNILLASGFTDVETGRDLSGLDRTVCARLQ